MLTVTYAQTICETIFPLDNRVKANDALFASISSGGQEDFYFASPADAYTIERELKFHVEVFGSVSDGDSASIWIEYAPAPGGPWNWYNLYTFSLSESELPSEITLPAAYIRAVRFQVSPSLNQDPVDLLLNWFKLEVVECITPTPSATFTAPALPNTPTRTPTPGPTATPSPTGTPGPSCIDVDFELYNSVGACGSAIVGIDFNKPEIIDFLSDFGGSPAYIGPAAGFTAYHCPGSIDPFYVYWLDGDISEVQFYYNGTGPWGIGSESGGGHTGYFAVSATNVEAPGQLCRTSPPPSTSTATATATATSTPEATDTPANGSTATAQAATSIAQNATATAQAATATAQAYSTSVSAGTPGPGTGDEGPGVIGDVIVSDTSPASSIPSAVCVKATWQDTGIACSYESIPNFTLSGWYRWLSGWGWYVLCKIANFLNPLQWIYDLMRLTQLTTNYTLCRSSVVADNLTFIGTEVFTTSSDYYDAAQDMIAEANSYLEIPEIGSSDASALGCDVPYFRLAIHSFIVGSDLVFYFWHILMVVMTISFVLAGMKMLATGVIYTPFSSFRREDD